MSRQYKNIIAYLETHSFKVLTTEEEYASMEKKIISIQCPCDHTFSMTSDSFNNKKREFTKKNLPMNSFCFQCYDSKDRMESVQKHIKTIKERTGHNVLEIDITSRKVVYRCCKCGDLNTSFINNLTRLNKGRCGNCENEHTKLDFDDIKTRVEKMGRALLTKPEEYKNNKMYLSILCVCGTQDNKKLVDIERDRRCELNCKQERYQETCMEKYGVSNPSKDPVIFQKIMSSIRRRKDHILPKSGRVITLQGYEPQAVDYLLEQKEDKYLSRVIEEDEIKVGVDIKSFDYIDVDGTERRYHPDLMIENMIVEVKGDWTLHHWKQTNIEKFKAVVKEGYCLRLLLFYENGEIQEDIVIKVKDDIKQIEELSFREKGRKY